MYSMWFISSTLLLALHGPLVSCYPHKPGALNHVTDSNIEKLQQLIVKLEMDPGSLPDITESVDLDDSSKLGIRLSGGGMTGFGKATRDGDYHPGSIPNSLNGTTRTPLLTTTFNYKTSGAISDQGTLKIVYHKVKAYFSISIDSEVNHITDAIIHIEKTGEISFFMKSDSSPDPITDAVKNKIKAKLVPAIEKIFEDRVSQLLTSADPNHVKELVSVFPLKQ